MTKKLILFCLHLVCFVFPQFCMGTVVPMFGGGLRHPGYADETVSTSAVQTLWRFQTGSAVYSSPALADGRLYVGSTDGCLYAISAADGQLIWKVQTGGAVNSSPALSGGLVYFSSRDGFFYALSAADGREKWRFETEGERWFEAKGLHFCQPRNQTIADVWDFFLSSPLIVDGKFYCGSGDGHVYALDAAMGKLIWKFKTGDVVHAAPAFDRGVIYIGSWDSCMYALNASDGRELWRYQTGRKNSNQTGIQASALVADGMVYFGSRDSFFYALNASDGRLMWRFDHKGSWVIASAALRNGVLYYGTSDSSQLFALDAKTGKQLWQQGVKSMSFSSTLAVRNGVLQGTLAGNLSCHDPESGALMWEFCSDAHRRNEQGFLKADGSPDYRKIFRSPVAKAFYLEDALLSVQRLLSTGSILSTPVVDNGVIYLGSADGGVYALK